MGNTYHDTMYTSIREELDVVRTFWETIALPTGRAAAEELTKDLDAAAEELGLGTIALPKTPAPPGLESTLFDLVHRLTQNPVKLLRSIQGLEMTFDMEGAKDRAERIRPIRERAERLTRKQMRVLKAISVDDVLRDTDGTFDPSSWEVGSLPEMPGRTAPGGRERTWLEKASLMVLIGAPGDEGLGQARAALDGGARLLQLRLKTGTTAERLATARKMVELVLEREEALLLLNDHVDLCFLAGTDGVHLGQGDCPPKEARKLLGRGRLVGGSVHDEAEWEGLKGTVDYVGVGTWFPSPTKPSLEAGDHELLAELVASADVPAFAIGGITLDNLDQVLERGIERIAVGSAITDSEDVTARTAAFLKRLP